MSNVCEICGKHKVQGGHIIRRGLAKKKGGIGMHVVKNTTLKPIGAYRFLFDPL